MLIVAHGLAGIPAPKSLYAGAVEVENHTALFVEVGGSDSGSVGTFRGDTSALAHATRHGERVPFAILIALYACRHFHAARKDQLECFLQVGSINNYLFPL